MSFVRTSQARAEYATPEELYPDLPRRKGSVPGLWAHQADILRTYAKQHVGTPDIALELPTGTGKTITGLLIAEWTRRTKRSRVIYACPTRQLALQVASVARREGIDAVTLIGSHNDWPANDHSRYEGAQAIAIMTYSAIFNSNPHVAPADLIIFDDAHAGSQYVSEKYAVTIGRAAGSGDHFFTVLGAVSPALDGVFLERLREAQPDPGVRDLTRMVVPLRQPGMVDALDRALSALPAPHKFQYSMIRDGLASCLVYVSYAGVLIRPLIPPTTQNAVFTDARQRLYLSATLGSGGELERSFGRPGIVRLSLPEGSTAPRSGRRFFVFPDFVEDTDPKDLAKAIVKKAGKALILAPKTDRAMDLARTLARKGWPVLGVDDVAEGMGPFAKLEHGTCGLAARYDGLDLPGNACRVVVLDGLPDQDNLQERFLRGRARAGAALAERIRTRVIQGAGRSTRNPNDTAIVVILDPALSRFLARPETEDALDPELQAEVRFGRENSQEREFDTVMANVESFLDQDSDDQWRENAEPILSDYRRESKQVLPSGTQALTDSAESEIVAWSYARVGRWEEASTHAGESARLIGAGGFSTKGYRAFWLYLAGVWADQAAAAGNGEGGRASAQSLIRQAESVMGLGSWVREMAPLPAMAVSDLTPADSFAITTIVTRLESGVNVGSHARKVGEMKAGLSQRSPSVYEPALTALGLLMGAEAKKPSGAGRCDSTWCWGNDLWVAVEAKSDHEPTGVVPHKDIRQANDQLRLLSSDRGVQIPAESSTVVISDKPAVHEDGIKSAELHVHIVKTRLVEEVAFDVESAWDDVISKRNGRTNQQLRELVSQAFSNRGVLPSQVSERLTREPIGQKSE